MSRSPNKNWRDRRPVSPAAQHCLYVCRRCNRLRTLDDRICPHCGAGGLSKMAATTALHLQATPPRPAVRCVHA